MYIINPNRFEETSSSRCSKDPNIFQQFCKKRPETIDASELRLKKLTIFELWVQPKPKGCKYLKVGEPKFQHHQPQQLLRRISERRGVGHLGSRTRPSGHGSQEEKSGVPRQGDLG